MRARPPSPLRRRGSPISAATLPAKRECEERATGFEPGDAIDALPATPPRSRGKVALRPETLASSIVLLLLTNVVQRSLGFGRAVLFCRWLEPEELGHWEMAYSFLLLAAPLAVLGLPGSFGRYLDRYRQQGRLRLFLRRTTVWTVGLAATVITLMALNREFMAGLVFGDASRAGLVGGVLVCLACVVGHHFLEAVFASLRMFRVVSLMHFVQSVSFACISLALLAYWRMAVSSVVIGYAAACLLSITGVVVWSVWRVERTPDEGTRIGHGEFWPPLMRFAVWVWVTNLLTNVFAIVDRYMIVHCANFTPAEALVQVGNYHTSNIVPMLLVSVANLLVGAMTPHLSHDWEAGRRDSVSGRLNLGLKLTTLVMLVAGIGVLLFCPLLFKYALEDKYADGLAVLPWTLASCVWFSLLLVAQTWLWCAEKSHLAAAPLAIGLALNVALNLALLPSCGLWGAIVATALSTLTALLMQLLVNHRCGMSFHRGTLLALGAPFLLTLGPAAAAVGTLGLVALAVTRGWIFTPAERAEIGAALWRRLAGLHSRLGRVT
ncbi:MAG: lipopolysaccharide biosynthesis protein [Lacipirellulaceae bacterium]